MITDNELATEYAAKPGEWTFERVTAPRASCVGLLHYRRALMRMLPGESETVRGVYVKRLDEWDQYRYVIRGHELTLEDTVAIVEGWTPMPGYPPRKRRNRKVMPLDTLPLFAGMGAAA